jgi:hypothetical protein
MHRLNVQLSEPTYAAIAQAAATSGVSVEAMAAEQLESDFSDGGDAPEGFFTPDILAEIDAARAEAREGKNVTMAEMRLQLAAQRETWLRNHRA